MQQRVHDHRGIRIRPARRDLDDGFGLGFCGAEVFGHDRELAARREVPVANEKVLQVVGAGAFDHQMRIPPVRLGRVDIAVADIDPTHKSRAGVDDNDLAVVTVIGAVGQGDEPDLIERECFNATGDKFINKFSPDAAAAKIVVNKPDLYSLGNLSNQDVFDLVAYTVILEDVIFHVDMVLRGFERGEYLRKFLFAIKQQADFVVAGQRAVVVQKQAGEFFMTFDFRFAAFPGLFRFVHNFCPYLFQQLIIGYDLLRIEFVFAIVRAHGKVNNDSYTRQQQGHQ